MEDLDNFAHGKGTFLLPTFARLGMEVVDIDGFEAVMIVLVVAGFLHI